ncbi:MAG: hypothetical protein ACHP65_07325 [Legionellales bacterium]
MGFQLVAYDTLAAGVKKSVERLLMSHKKDPDKAGALKLLVPQRRIQAEFLLKVTELLNTTPVNPKNPEARARVLNTAVYYVRAQIEESYKKAIYPYNDPSESTFYVLLTTILDIRKDNQPVRDDVIKMYSALLGFIRSHVYVLSDAGKGYLPEQAFSKAIIEGYVVEDDILALTDTLHALVVEQVKAAAAEQEKKLAEAELAAAAAQKSDVKPGGFFSYLIGRSSAAASASNPLLPPSPAVAAETLAAALSNVHP